MSCKYTKRFIPSGCFSFHARDPSASWFLRYSSIKKILGFSWGRSFTTANQEIRSFYKFMEYTNVIHIIFFFQKEDSLSTQKLNILAVFKMSAVTCIRIPVWCRRVNSTIPESRNQIEFIIIKLNFINGTNLLIKLNIATIRLCYLG